MMYLRLLAAVCFIISLSFPAAAEEKEDTAQKWSQTEQSGVASSVPMEFFSSEVYFDPSMLDKSKIVLTATAHPPGEEMTDKNMQSGIFESTKIRRVKGNVFEAEGTMSIGDAKRTIKIPFTAAFDKTSAEPKIILDGAFDLNTSQYASSPEAEKYPTVMPIRFRITAEPVQ